MSHPRSTRRNFLKSSLVAGQAAAFALSLGDGLLAQTAPGESSRSRGPFKIGILGCGSRSRAHIAALNDVPEIDIAALCDVMPGKMDQRAGMIRKKPQPRKYEEMEKMIAQEDLDAVAIVLPNHLHKTATIAALQAGRHVFCEKPMALTVADCNEMIAAADRAGKAIQIGTQRRHGARYKAAVEAMRAASVGRILSSAVNSYRGDWRHPAKGEYPDGVPYWRLIQEQCGGVVYEMGAHVIDFNNWIFDSEPVTVASLQGVNHPALPKRDSTDHGAVLVRYANDALMNYGGNLYTQGAAGADYFFAANATVALEEQRLAIHYGGGRGTSNRAPAPSAIELPAGDGTSEQWKHFAKVLAGEADPYPSGQIGRQTIQICQAASLSARERSIISVKDLG